MHSVVLELRPWLPRYRASILSEHGALVAQRTFWTLRGARAWIRSLVRFPS